MGGGGGAGPVPGLSGGRGGLPPGPPRGGSGPDRPIGGGGCDDLTLPPPMLRPEGGGGGRGPVRGEDWFLPRDGGLSFGGGGRGPDRLCGGGGPWLLSELFLWGRRGVLWSSAPAGEGGMGGGPGRPGGRGGAPPLAGDREAGEDETEGEGLELTEGGGGGTSRGMDGR